MLRAFPRTPELLTRCYEDLERRKQVEVEKAIRKYGTTALDPMGKQDLDTLDYQINEMVGLFRYIEMNVNRLRLLQGTSPEVGKACSEGVHSLRDLLNEVEQHTLALIGVRERLLDKGMFLGRAEAL